MTDTLKITELRAPELCSPYEQVQELVRMAHFLKEIIALTKETATDYATDVGRVAATIAEAADYIERMFDFLAPDGDWSGAEEAFDKAYEDLPEKDSDVVGQAFSWVAKTKHLPEIAALLKYERKRPRSAVSETLADIAALLEAILGKDGGQPATRH